MKIRTTCNRDCPDACGIVATVEDGKVVRLEGDADHPVTDGFLCYRTNRFLERQYDPDRILTPLVRKEGTLQSASWDEALDRIAEAMLRIRDESGPGAIFHYRSGGSLGVMKHVTDYFFESFGPVAIKSGDICSGAGDDAQVTDFGDEDSQDLFDLLDARTILIWGKNPFVSNVHLLPVLKQAADRGSRLVMIDPVHHRGASLCDTVLQPRPGGDVALALGLIRLLWEIDAVDPAAADYCDHLDALREDAFAKDVAGWAAEADVTEAQLREVARLYADGPSTILVGWGMQRRAQGSATVRLLDALGAISGNLGVPGGGVSFYFKRRGAFDLSFSKGLEIAPRSIPEPLLGPGLLAAKDPEIRMVWVTAANPVAMCPESATVAKALRSRELTVVVDGFPTDTVDCADIVLPTTTMLEDDDLVGAYGHHWIGNVRPVIPPAGESKTDYEIVQALAPRVGLGERFSMSARDWKERLLSHVDDKGASLEQLESGAVRSPIAPARLFADRKFPTPSGKVNLIHGIRPEPACPTPERPLLLTAVATRKSQASQTTAAAQAERLICTVHPEAALGFADGERARLESEIGELEVQLRFDSMQRLDIALTDKGGWIGKGRCANLLVRAKATDAGGGACYYDTPVRLLKLDTGGV